MLDIKDDVCKTDELDGRVDGVRAREQQRSERGCMHLPLANRAMLSDAMRRAAEEGARLLYAARNRRHRAAQQPGEAPSGAPQLWEQWAFEPAALGSSSGLGNQS